MAIKEIKQNPERYSKNNLNWLISATGSIPPLVLPIGEEPKNLQPVLLVDGVVVKVGDNLLISQNTLDTIVMSNNPHYDIAQNGTVITTSGKSGSIGLTIPILELNVDSLVTSAENRTFPNNKAGVVDVEYIYQGIETAGIPNHLIDQINYTLNKGSERPSDTYTLTELQLAPPENYDIKALNIVTLQDTGSLFSFTKLSEFISGVNEGRKLLQQDFNMIKGIFFSGSIPTDSTTYSITKMATAEDDETGSPTKQVVFKTTDLVTNETPITQKIQDNANQAIATTNKQLTQVVSDFQSAQAGDQQSIQSIQAQVATGGSVTNNAVEQIKKLQAVLANQNK